ncbi:MAG: energy transducer TonB [Gammaproteobacteria bacterium]|nr:energy transducer TonB [Gammaproteobacteria bacterium]
MALLVGCSSEPSVPDPIPKDWLYSVPDSPDLKVAIFPIRRFRPVYPHQALVKGIQGCVSVGFRLDSNGYPMRLQAFASVPNGVFDEAAIRTVAKWQFRTTNLQGQQIAPPPEAQLYQTIVFSLYGSPAKSRSIVSWICGQTERRVLIASPAPATVPAPTISTVRHGAVDLAGIRVKPGTSLTNGWVDVGFCIDEKGDVAHATVEDSSPPELYDKAAIAALETWSFDARQTLGGDPVKTCGLKYRIKVIGAASLVEKPAVINQREMAIPIGDLDLPQGSTPDRGRVTLQYCIDKDGSVSNANVIASKPAGAFDKAAIQVLHFWKYWPRTVNGTVLRTCNLRTPVVFKLGSDDLVWIRTTAAKRQ